jgi:catechol 2,3-dioxygenase-like lactoylglutathione lyase family enzyme
MANAPPSAPNHGTTDVGLLPSPPGDTTIEHAFDFDQGGSVNPLIHSLDFIGVPSRDAARSRAFYVDTLGLRPDPQASFEFWVGDTCFGIWEPESVGMPFAPQTAAPPALRVDDVAAARAALEEKGIVFMGATLDTGVCHMALFSDPDGNALMLHHRYAPRT